LVKEGEVAAARPGTRRRATTRAPATCAAMAEEAMASMMGVVLEAL
jgi:hypothetical protein